MAVFLIERPQFWDAKGIVLAVGIATFFSAMWFAFGFLGYRVTADKVEASKGAEIVMLAATVAFFFGLVFLLARIEAHSRRSAKQLDEPPPLTSN